MGHPDLFRSFAAGSRQAPDPHDQFLEKENFYRKHTPRDPSSLFRCISEQLFDTQTYFRRVREECCAYMLRNREYFESHVDGDFDEYMEALSRLRTKGTLLELRALAYRYHRNVMLFEPYTLGNPFIMQPQYTGEPMFQVFVTPDYHFDSVYKMSEIEDAAYCQSLVYEVLYTHVFRLPDVAYAVERMLHDTTTVGSGYQQQEHGETDGGGGGDSTKVVRAITDGRSCDANLCSERMTTYCILEDYRMCHFHNEFFEDYLQSINTAVDRRLENYNRAGQNNNSYQSYHQYQPRYEGALLKSADQSCVRQLLNEGITPFPYKVAKALDPYIYRNIEFDVWNDLRKQWRLRFTYRRYINVGDKCFIRLNEGDAQTAVPPKNGSADDNKALVQYRQPPATFPPKVYIGYVQHIEKMSNLYHVYVEELGERLVVQGSTLRACNNGHHQSGITGHRRDFTVIGLSGRGRMFDNYHWRSPKYPYDRHQALLRNARNGNGHYRLNYSPYGRPRYNQLQANSDCWDDDDMRLLKKNTKNSDAAADHPPMELSEKPVLPTGNIFEDELALKELLYSPCYDGRCNYFNEIVAMPAFIPGGTQLNGGVGGGDGGGGGGDAEENNNDPPKEYNNDPLYGSPSNEVAFENNSGGVATEGAAATTAEGESSGAEIVDEEGRLLKVASDEGQGIAYGPFPADPNAFYAVGNAGQQFLTNAAPTFYMPTAAAPMDLQGSTYYPCYRGNGPPYYYNYVYTSSTGTTSTASSVAPYMLNSPGGQSTASYVSPPLDASNIQFVSIPNLVQRRDLLQSETPVNVNALPSFSPKGQDLPVNDLGTLRFYYNLGIEYFAYLAAVQGAPNALHALQNEPVPQLGIENGVGPGTDNNSTVVPAGNTSTSPTASEAAVAATTSVDNELKGLSIEGNGKRNQSTSIGTEVVERASHSGTRNSTPSSHSDSGGGGSMGHHRGAYQGGGGAYNNRRPPFTGGRGFNRGGPNMGGFRGVGGRHGPGGPMHCGMNNGGAGSGGGNVQQQSNDKGKDLRSQQGNNNPHHHHNSNPNQQNNNNRRHGPGRFNHHQHYNNNGHSNYNPPSNGNMLHRRPLNQSTGPSSSDYQGDNRSTMGEMKSQSQSPYRNANNNGGHHNKSQHNMQQTQSPNRGVGLSSSGKGGADGLQLVGSPYSQQHQGHGNMDPVMIMNQPLYAQPDGGPQNPLITPPANYFGSQGVPFPYSGPPPHLPPPFGGNAVVGQSGHNNLMGVPPMTGPAPPSSQQHQQPPLYNNSPYYATTYTTYIPLDLNQQPMQPFGMGVLPAGDINGGGANVIVGPMSFVPQQQQPQIPYANNPQHLMGQNNVGTPPNYYLAPTISGEAPVTPVSAVATTGQSAMNWSGAMIAGAAAETASHGAPWSSSGSGTPGNVNSGPSSGIGSTESSPPYNNGGLATLPYNNNQQTPTGYAYPFPQAHSASHHQQHFWYAPQQQQPLQASVPATVATPPQDGKLV